MTQTTKIRRYKQMSNVLGLDKFNILHYSVDEEHKVKLYDELIAYMDE